MQSLCENFYMHAVHVSDKRYMHISNFTCIRARVHAVFRALLSILRQLARRQTAGQSKDLRSYVVIQEDAKVLLFADVDSKAKLSLLF